MRPFAVVQRRDKTPTVVKPYGGSELAMMAAAFERQRRAPLMFIICAMLVDTAVRQKSWSPKLSKYGYLKMKQPS